MIWSLDKIMHTDKSQWLIRSNRTQVKVFILRNLSQYLFGGMRKRLKFSDCPIIHLPHKQGKDRAF